MDILMLKHNILVISWKHSKAVSSPISSFQTKDRHQLWCHSMNRVMRTRPQLLSVMFTDQSTLDSSVSALFLQMDGLNSICIWSWRPSKCTFCPGGSWEWNEESWERSLIRRKSRLSKASRIWIYVSLEYQIKQNKITSRQTSLGTLKTTFVADRTHRDLPASVC